MITTGDHSPALRRYYRTAVWRDRAKAIRKRDHYACRACNKRPQRKRWWQVWRRRDWLVVHHLSYAEWTRNPGNEPDDDLITLDRACHEETHARHRMGHFGSHEGSLREATMYVVRLHQDKIARQRTKMDRRLSG